MTPRLRVAAQWVLWGAVLVALTVTLHDVRTAIQQVHVALLYLLLVVGATAYGGRALGFTIAIASFVLLDYYFQAPFDTLSVGTSLDWLVLVIFVATAGVATHLLSRATAASTRAEQHAAEVADLSRLGSELLSAGRAGDALAAIAAAVRESTRAQSCRIFAVREGGVRLVVSNGDGDAITEEEALRCAQALLLGGAPAGDLAHWADQREADVSGPQWQAASDGNASRVLAPLWIHGQLVGVLGLVNAQAGFAPGASHRYLDALTYYAALATERVGAVGDAERREAEAESERLRHALLASVSHDLRTPLSTVKVLAQDTVARRDIEAALQNASAIEEQADRLTRLVNNLLDVTRLRGGALPLHPDVNGAEDLIGAVARQVAGVLHGRPLERRIAADGPVLLGRFDFVHTMRILSNLIENAARYSPAGAPIVLSAWRDGDRVLFEVADHGPGIPPAERVRVFDAFTRVASAAPDVGGVGLGLYIARQLAESQGGTLTLAETGPGGSRFVLSLPAVDDEATDDGGEAL